MTPGEICALFNKVESMLNTPVDRSRRERWIFEQVYADPGEALERMYACNRDVTTCPAEVIAFCQRLLAPGAHIPPQQRGLRAAFYSFMSDVYHEMLCGPHAGAYRSRGYIPAWW